MNRNTFNDLQEKWLTALESGEYRQAAEHLCKDGALCCLGVATATLDPNHQALVDDGWEAEDWCDSDLAEEDPEWFGGLIDGMVAPPDVVAKLHLYGSEGNFRFGFKHQGKSTSLVNLNDDLGLTFPEIAAFIRAHPWAVFTNFDKPVTP